MYIFYLKLCIVWPFLLFDSVVQRMFHCIHKIIYHLLTKLSGFFKVPGWRLRCERMGECSLSVAKRRGKRCKYFCDNINEYMYCIFSDFCSSIHTEHTCFFSMFDLNFRNDIYIVSFQQHATTLVMKLQMFIQVNARFIISVLSWISCVSGICVLWLFPINIYM